MSRSNPSEHHLNICFNKISLPLICLHLIFDLETGQNLKYYFFLLRLTPQTFWLLPGLYENIKFSMRVQSFEPYCAPKTEYEDGSENISAWRSIITHDTLGERFWKQQFYDVCREWSSEKMRGLISCRAVTAGPRGNDHLLFLNSSHLANWEHLRAPELKLPSGLTLDNQWPCPRRGRREGRVLRPNDWLRNPSTSRIKRLKTPLLTKVSFAGDNGGSFSSLWCFRLLMSWAWLVGVN